MLSVGVYALVGFFALPLLLKTVIVKKAPEILHRVASVREIKLNPFALSLSVRGFSLKEPSSDETFLSFDDFSVNLEVISILKRSIILKDATLKRPFIKFVRYKDKINIGDLLEPSRTEKKTSKKEAESSNPVSFSIQNINILDGIIRVEDQTHKEPVNLSCDNITLNISSLSSSKDNKAGLSLSFLIGKKGRFTSESFLVLNPMYIETTFALKDIDIERFEAYAQEKLNIAVKGLTSISGNINLSNDPKKGYNASYSGKVGLKDFLLTDINSGDKLLGFKSFSINGIDTHYNPMLINIEDIALNKFHVNALINRDGELNFTKILKKQDSVAKNPPKQAKSPKTPNPGKTRVVTKQSNKSVLEKVKIDSIRLQGGSISFADRHVNSLSGNKASGKGINFSTKLHEINLSLTSLAFTKNSKANISLSFLVDDKGSFSSDGFFVLDPLEFGSNYAVKNINTAAFQPYIADKLNLMVKSGLLSTSGDIRVKHDADKSYSALYKGKIDLKNFSFAGSTDGKDILNFKSLAISGIESSYKPVRVKIAKVDFADFYVNTVVEADGSLNFDKILKKDKTKSKKTDKEPDTQKPVQVKKIDSSKTQKKEKIGTSVRIGKVGLHRGHVRFADRSVKPSYLTELLDINSSISFSSEQEPLLADIDFSGKLNEHAPLKITGKVNPIKEKLYVDLNVDFANIGLSPLSPYSGKYISYKLDKGKLSLDLRYKINKKVLEAENNISIDQLTLGEKVKSPDATSLPLGLAIALLQDRNGKIKLSVPVSQSIDDPKFSIGATVYNAVLNLLEKAVMSPFTLIGSLIGGGEELSYIEFDPGTSVITGKNSIKLDKLIKALQQRPKLKLEIKGYADAELDRESLLGYRLESKVRKQKFDDLVKRGLTDIKKDEVKVEPEEYIKYLAMAYKLENMAKSESNDSKKILASGEKKDITKRGAGPKEQGSIANKDKKTKQEQSSAGKNNKSLKKVSKDEMEELIRSGIKVTDDDLRALSYARAKSVQDYILKSNGVDSKRVFIVEPKILVPNRKENVKNSRVDLKLL